MLIAAAGSLVAMAADARTVDLSAELSSDERRRGLSWSDGRAAVAVAATAHGPADVDVGVRVVTVRDDPRHLGAGAVADVTVGHGRDLGGGWRADAFVTAHLFAGATGRADYVEGGAGIGYSIGPAEVGADLRYAPAQSPIGGDNLYLAARARLGIPATPWTVDASVGRSSGAVDDPVRAARLRPGGGYADWALGVTRYAGPLEIGLRYTGTDIRDTGDPLTRHAGHRVAARIAITL